MDLIPLSLFDERVPVDQMSKLAEAFCRYILEYDIPEFDGPQNFVGSGFGKHVMPAVSFSLELVDFMGPRSPLFFRALKIDNSFLEKRASERA